jgi:small subunit ribosomal protein S2
MSVSLDALLQAGVHFGHQTRRWNPKMRRFIFAERNGIHIIDLQKTARQIELAQQLVREVVLRGEQVLYVCTKRQLGGIIRAEAERAGAMYVTERWLGGMLTNFATVKKQTKRLKELEAGTGEGGEFENYTKKEQLMFNRQRAKLEKNLSGIKSMTRTRASCSSSMPRRSASPSPRPTSSVSRSSPSATPTPIRTSSRSPSPATTTPSARWT